MLKQNESIVKDLNEMKLMYIYFDEGKMIPEMLTFNYYDAARIQSRFAVMGNMMSSLLEFSSLKSAIRFVELLAADEHFYTQEFYNKFRIVEITGPDDSIQIVSIIVNLIDFFDVLCAIKDGKFDKKNFNDEDFNVYYEKFINLI